MRLLSFFDEWFTAAHGVGAPMYPYQGDLVTRFLVDRTSQTINKARRTGISTTVAACSVWDAVFEAMDVLVFSNSKDNAAFILERARNFLRALGNFPVAIPKTETDRMTWIRFENGGQIRSFAASPETVRGYDADRLYFDEFAHFSGEAHLDRKMWQAVVPMVAPTGGPVVVLSTPGAMGNLYWDMWRDEPEERKLLIHWTECPRLVENVRIEQLAFGKVYWVGDTRMEEREFLMEFSNEFDPGYGSAIPQDAIMAAEDPEAKWVEML